MIYRSTHGKSIRFSMIRLGILAKKINLKRDKRTHPKKEEEDKSKNVPELFLLKQRAKRSTVHFFVLLLKFLS